MCWTTRIVSYPTGPVECCLVVGQPGCEADYLLPSGSEYVDLYILSSIHRHGVALN
jgi:hypothetical protein